MAFATIAVAAGLLAAALVLSSQEQPPAIERPRTVGVAGCRDCHSTKTIGDQHSVWINEKHSQAYQSLLTQKAKDIAKEKGVEVLPHVSSDCLRCHVTGHWPKSFSADQFERSFNREEGVSCEACHGPGSLYRTQEIMSDRKKAMDKGLFIPDEKTCIGCHNTESPTFKSFNYDESWKKIEHPIPKEPPTDKGITWLSTMDAGIAAAQKDNKPLIISYWFPKGCPICEGMIPTFSDPAVGEAVRTLVPVRLVNPTQEYLTGVGLQDAATRFALPDGFTVLKDMYGSYSPELLLHVIERVKMTAAAEVAYKASIGQGAPPASATVPLFHRDKLSVHALKAAEFAYENLARVGDQYLGNARKVLEPHGAEACDEALVSWLWSPRSRVKPQALRLMSQQTRPVGKDFFYDLLAFAFDPADDLRIAALEGLARLRDKRALQPVAQWLLCDNNQEVQQKAFGVLARLGDPGATQRLISFFLRPGCCFEETCPFRPEALVALFHINDPAMIAPVTEIAQKFPAHRALAVAVLGERCDPGAAQFLLDCATSDGQQFEVRNEAVFALAKIVCGMQADKTADAGKLKELQNKLFFGLLQVLRTAENAELRASVCEVYGTMNAQGMAPELVHTAKEDPSEIPRAYALIALADMFVAAEISGVKRDEVVEIVDRAVASPCFLERNMAVDALCRLGITDYAPLAREALRDTQSKAVEDRKALTIAAKTAARLGDIEAVPLLVALLSDDDLDTSRVAILCLEKLTGHSLGEPGAVPMDVPRILLAGVNAPSVGAERLEILRAVRRMNLGWTMWWAENGEKHMAKLRRERAEAPKTALRMQASPIVYGGSVPEEFGLWLRIEFRGADAAAAAGGPDLPLTPRGRLRVLEQVGDRAGAQAVSALAVVVNRGVWQEVAHTKDEQGNEAAPPVEGPHCSGGAIFVRIASGFKTGEERHPGFVVEFVGGAGSATAEVEPFKY